jgi:hypothetical protein
MIRIWWSFTNTAGRVLGLTIGAKLMGRILKAERPGGSMTPEEIKSIIEMLDDDTRLWDLDAGDWLAYVEELLAEVERLNTIISGLQGRDETQKRNCSLR